MVLIFCFLVERSCIRTQNRPNFFLCLPAHINGNTIHKCHRFWGSGLFEYCTTCQVPSSLSQFDRRFAVVRFLRQTARISIQQPWAFLPVSVSILIYEIYHQCIFYCSTMVGPFNCWNSPSANVSTFWLVTNASGRGMPTSGNRYQTTFGRWWCVSCSFKCNNHQPKMAGPERRRAWNKVFVPIVVR